VNRTLVLCCISEASAFTWSETLILPGVINAPDITTWAASASVQNKNVTLGSFHSNQTLEVRKVETSHLILLRFSWSIGEYTKLLIACSGREKWIRLLNFHMKFLSWSLYSHYLPVSKWIASKISFYVHSDNIFLHFVWLQWGLLEHF